MSSQADQLRVECDALSFIHMRVELDRIIQHGENGAGNIQPRNHTILFGDDLSVHHRVCGDNAVGGYITCTDIFVKRAADGFKDFVLHGNKDYITKNRLRPQGASQSCAEP